MGVLSLTYFALNMVFDKKDGYRQQNVRQRQKNNEYYRL